MLIEFTFYKTSIDFKFYILRNLNIKDYLCPFFKLTIIILKKNIVLLRCNSYFIKCINNLIDCIMMFIFQALYQKIIIKLKEL